MPVGGLEGRVPIGVLGLVATPGAEGVADRVPAGILGLAVTLGTRGVADVGLMTCG